MNTIILLVIVLITYILFKNNDRISKINSKIPGPLNRNIPIVGSLVSMKGNTHLVLQKWYRKYGSIYYLKMGNVNTVVLTDFPVIRKAFIEHSEVFSSRFSLPSRYHLNGCQDIVNEKGVKHSILKKVILSDMTPIRIKKAESHIQSECIKLISLLDKHADNGKPFLLNKYISMFSLNIILRFLFGVDYPYKEVDDSVGLVDCIKRYFIAAAKVNPADYIPFLPQSKETAYYKGNVELSRQINILIEKYKSMEDTNGEKELSILSKLLAECEKGSFTWTGLVSSCIDIIIAGTDTSSNIITFALVDLINNPNIQKKLYENIKVAIKNENEENEDQLVVSYSKYRSSIPYLQLVIKEAFRKNPVAPLSLPHITTSDIEIEGYTIAAGTTIIQNVYSTHRSEKYYQSPNEFIPERFIDVNDGAGEGFGSGTHSNLLHFGIGVRDCIGKNLADAEIMSALATLLNRYEFLNPNPSTPLNDNGIFGIALACPDVYVSIKKRI